MGAGTIRRGGEVRFSSRTDSPPLVAPELANTSNQARRLVTLGLGALWILDGLFELQPGLKSHFAVAVIGNAMETLPSPFYLTSMNMLSTLVIPYAALWDLLFASLQLSLGVALVAGSARLKHVALLASVAWGSVVWVFGEGMAGILSPGGTFPGTPSILNGFPGPAMVYVLIALLLLMPENRWRLSGRFSVVADAPALVFLACAAVQAAPLMWTSYGQASIFVAGRDYLPSQLAVTLKPFADFTIAHPVIGNTIEVGANLVAAIGLLFAGKSRWVFAFAFGWLAFVWWFGLGLGGMLTGLGTDPGAPPAIMLLMGPALVSSRSLVRELPRKPAPQIPGALGGGHVSTPGGPGTASGSLLRLVSSRLVQETRRGPGTTSSAGVGWSPAGRTTPRLGGAFEPTTLRFLWPEQADEPAKADHYSRKLLAPI